MDFVNLSHSKKKRIYVIIIAIIVSLIAIILIVRGLASEQPVTDGRTDPK